VPGHKKPWSRNAPWNFLYTTDVHYTAEFYVSMWNFTALVKIGCISKKLALKYKKYLETALNCNF
jgi:hypothetical protein